MEYWSNERNGNRSIFFILRLSRKSKLFHCGSGFQPRQLISRLEAAPTEILSDETWTFQISGI